MFVHSHPTFTLQPHSITRVWPVLIPKTIGGWVAHYVPRRFAQPKSSPIPGLTRPDVDWIDVLSGLLRCQTKWMLKSYTAFSDVSSTHSHSNQTNHKVWRDNLLVYPLLNWKHMTSGLLTWSISAGYQSFNTALILCKIDKVLNIKSLKLQPWWLADHHCRGKCRVPIGTLEDDSVLSTLQPHKRSYCDKTATLKFCVQTTITFATDNNTTTVIIYWWAGT